MNVMRVQLGKELAQLRMAWWVAVGLALSPLWLRLGMSPQDGQPLSLLLFYVAALLPAMEVFGREFGGGTMSMLLAQPVSRRALWRVKVGTLAGVSATVIGVYWLATLATWGGWPGQEGWAVSWPWLTLGVLVTVQGFALVFSVWTRLGAGVFWLALLAPLGLTGLMSVVVDKLTGSEGAAGDVGVWVVWGTPLVLGLAGWFLAYRRFLVMEDAGFLDQEVDLSWWRRGSARSVATGVTARRAVTGQLVRKELRLQSVNVVLILLFTLVMVVIFLLQGRDWNRNAWMESALIGLWGLGWVAVPLLVGVLPVAEERRLGVHEWQLTLGVSRRRQWWIKVGVTYGVAFGLGVVLPALLEMAYLGERFFTWQHSGFQMARMVAWLLGTTLALYASSMSRQVLQALSVCALLGLAGWVGWALCLQAMGEYQSPMALGTLLVLATLVPVLLWLAGRNQAEARMDGRMVKRNVAIIGGAIGGAVLVTAAVWGRAWEVFWREPVAGPALVAKAGVKAGIRVGSGATLVVLTPEGRLWAWMAPRKEGDSSRQEWLSNEPVWVDATSYPVGRAGVREDGTLWCWGSWPVMSNKVATISATSEAERNRAASMARPGTVTSSMVQTHFRPAGSDPWRVGGDADWVAVSAGGNHVVALKRDGTVWGWGDARMWQSDSMQAREGLEPTPLPGGTNVVALGSAWSGPAAIRADGSVWLWGQEAYMRGIADSLVRTGRLEHVPVPLQVLDASAGVERIVQSYGISAGLSTSKGLTVWRAASEVAPQLPCALGDMELKDAAVTWGGPHNAWAVTGEGELWAWGGELGRPEFWSRMFMREAGERIGSRSDWLGVAVVGNGSYVGLTADGWVWTWGWPLWEGQNWSRHVLLAPSYKPRQVARLVVE